MVIRQVTKDDWNEWLRLRFNLWPEVSLLQHEYEMSIIIKKGFSNCKMITDVLVLECENSLGGFIEVGLHKEWKAFGIQKVGYIKGWYVDSKIRGEGNGRRLVENAEQWALKHGCKEIISTTRLENLAGIVVYRRLGFYDCQNKRQRILFRKQIVC